MELFAIADTHFGHGRPNQGRTGILKHTDRPWPDVRDMDEGLIANWNEIVPPNGLVWVLGDFAWRNHAHYLQALHGKKILVTGSHDRMNEETLRLFKEVHRGGAMLQAGNDRPFWCAHCCHRVWERGHYSVPHLFGHSHGRLQTYNLSLDVGVDAGWAYRKYYPIPLDDILAWMALREGEMRAAGRIKPGGVGGKELYRQDDVSWALRQAAAEETEPKEDADEGGPE